MSIKKVRSLKVSRKGSKDLNGESGKRINEMKRNDWGRKGAFESDRGDGKLIIRCSWSTVPSSRVNDGSYEGF